MKPNTRSSSKRMKQSTLDFSKQSPAKQNAPSSSPSAQKKNTRTSTRSQNLLTPSKRSHVVDSDTSDEEDVLALPSRVEDYLDIGEAETSDDNKIYSSPTKKARRNKAKEAAFVVEESDDSDDEDPLSAKPRRTKRMVVKDTTDDDDASDDEIEVHAPTLTPRKRKRDDAMREEAELAEDLENLRSSPVRTTPLKSKLSSRQSALDKLKSRRASIHKSSSARTHRNVIIDSDDEDAEDNFTSSLAVRGLDPEEPFEVSDDSENEDEDYETTAREVFNETANDQEFLASSNSEDELGVPAELPFEFSALARMKPKQAFEIVVEWMVQKKINPAFDRDAAKYVSAFRRIEDEAVGLVGSKFVSAVWTPEFTLSLRARPEIAIWQEEHALLKNCEACNRTSHPATFRIQFSGKPYDSHTLEEVEQDTDGDDSEEAEDDDDSAAEQGEVYDSNGALIAPAGKVYSLGRFCMANAKTAHTLHHWKVHLSSWVVDHLREKMGELTPAKIVERDGWKVGKRRKDADRIVAEMDRDGTIKSLYKEYKSEIDAARDSKSGRSERWG